ncbi:MAG: hypothetical protein KatS3mg051_0674 [Anaerolineae bacterium]|nr:MAG: hypothetical protein KatS3mg051_0674 [Anaerolineae bacterium]
MVGFHRFLLCSFPLREPNWFRVFWTCVFLVFCGLPGREPETVCLTGY